MLLRCIRAFGNFVPGDELVVPEGSTFDNYHFEAVPVAADSGASQESE